MDFLRHPLIAALGLAAGLTAGAVRAEPDVGSYLAAREAMIGGDYESASNYLLRAILGDPQNVRLLESALVAQVGRGEVGLAVPIARAMAEQGTRSQLSNMVLFTDMAGAGNWRGILEQVDAGPVISPLADALARGWALVGAGDMQAALDAFDRVVDEPGMRSFGLYHKALALAYAGDFEAAAEILALPPSSGLRRDRAVLMAQAQVMDQLDQGAEALAYFNSLPGLTEDPMLADVMARLEAGERLPWTQITSPVAGLAETFRSVAGLILDETDDTLVLVNLRMTTTLSPDQTEAWLLSGEILDRMEQYPLALAAYGQVPGDHPLFPITELRRADVLYRSGDTGGAIDSLQALAGAYPELAAASGRLADFLRLEGRDAEAVAAYDAALDRAPAGAQLWRLHFSRAISHFNLDDWPAAQTDFEAALALMPDQPVVLNFYGYSLVERHERLDEALDMIERAVAGDPENGAIVDSLGWALYRLDRFDEAVVHLERAVALEPGDPTVNDHLGDAYWQVGREREARFQWQRALSFHPEDEIAALIRTKLAEGLDPEAATAPRAAQASATDESGG